MKKQYKKHFRDVVGPPNMSPGEQTQFNEYVSKSVVRRLEAQICSDCRFYELSHDTARIPGCKLGQRVESCDKWESKNG